MKPGHHQRSSYGSESSFVPRLLPRIPVSSQFLLEFSHAIYFAMYVTYILHYHRFFHFDGTSFCVSHSLTNRLMKRNVRMVVDAF